MQNSLDNGLGSDAAWPHRWADRASRPIPQQRYTSNQTHDPQYQAYISFCDDGGPGKPLSSILEPGFRSTDWRDRAPWIDAVGQDVGQKISLRVNWPGYHNKSKILNARVENARAEAIPLGRLLRKLAEAIRDIMDELSVMIPDNPTYKISSGIYDAGIRFEDVRLAGIERVGRGSWQPRLNYVPPAQR